MIPQEVHKNIPVRAMHRETVRSLLSSHYVQREACREKADYQFDHKQRQ